MDMGLGGLPELMIDREAWPALQELTSWEEGMTRPRQTTGGYHRMWQDVNYVLPILKEINPEYSFAGRTDAEAEALTLWPPDVKSLLIEKDPDAGKDWRQEKKGTTEDEMVGWYHQLDGHEFK